MSKEAYTPPSTNKETYNPPTAGSAGFASVPRSVAAPISYLCAGIIGSVEAD